MRSPMLLILIWRMMKSNLGPKLSDRNHQLELSTVDGNAMNSRSQDLLFLVMMVNQLTLRRQSMKMVLSLLLRLADPLTRLCLSAENVILIKTLMESFITILLMLARGLLSIALSRRCSRAPLSRSNALV